MRFFHWITSSTYTLLGDIFYQIFYHIEHKLALYMSLTILQFIYFDNNDEMQTCIHVAYACNIFINILAMK